MMRSLIIALLVANALVLAWTQGWLEPVVRAPVLGDREPERLQQQGFRFTYPELSAALAAATTPGSR